MNSNLSVNVMSVKISVKLIDFPERLFAAAKRPSLSLPKNRTS